MKYYNTRYFFLTFLIFSLSSFSCKDEINNTELEIPIPYPYSTDHFTFYYTSYDSLTIKATADSIEDHYARVLADLLIDTVLKTTVHFHKSYEDLVQAVQDPNLPSWVIGISTARDTIHMLSPNHPDQIYQYMIIVLVHEFTHCVTLNIRPSFGNNPRWLWESVALFAAGQFIHPSRLTYMVQQNPPTLSQLNSFSNTQIYEVGYLLAEFIVENWSREHLKNMILSNGNISQSLGMMASEFQTAWFQFVKNKYHI